jgi:hypothetical protein
MKLTGVEVSVDSLFKLEPNTMLAVVSDERGEIRLVKIDNRSLREGEAILRVTASSGDQTKPQSGCYVFVEGRWVWTDPCPY